MYDEQYAVELTVFNRPSSDAPRLGDAAEWSDPLARQQIVAKRRTPTRVQAVREHRYVAELDPTVAESSVGYLAVTGTVPEGLAVTVLVGAGPEDASRTSLKIVGELTDVEMGRRVGPDGGTMGTGGWAVDLPIVDRRTIDSSMPIQFARSTVVSVVPGFEDGAIIAVVARVEKIKE